MEDVSKRSLSHLSLISLMSFSSSASALADDYESELEGGAARRRKQLQHIRAERCAEPPTKTSKHTVSV